MKFAGARLTIAIVALGLQVSCSGTQEVKKEIPSPPGWVMQEPDISGMICAVGMSGPTYYRDEAKDYALESARAELSRSISVHIETIMVDISTDKGSTVDEATVTQMSSWASSVVLENSEAKGYWYDADGVISGRKNITFALVCMPRKFDKKQLEIGLRDADFFKNKTPQEISRNADDIIKFLEEER